MSDIFGIDGQTVLLLAAAALFGLWWLARSPRIAHGNAVRMNVFCLRCNWEGKVQVNSRKCMKCGSQSVSVLSV